MYFSIVYMSKDRRKIFKRYLWKGNNIGVGVKFPTHNKVPHLL